MTKRKENPQPAGRPTDFKPEYGAEILNLMAAGYSLVAAAADLGFHRQRVYDWVDRHPEFADTVKLAMAKRQMFLERRLLSAEQGPIVTSTIFALKNAAPHDWREKVVQEHTGPDGGAIQQAVTFDASRLPAPDRAQLRRLVNVAEGKGEDD